MPTPAEFTDRLRRLVDPALVCYYNPIKGRYIIDRCTHPEASSGLHACTTACHKINVMIVEEAGQYRDLGDDLIGALKAMDTWEKYGSAENMLAVTNRESAGREEKAEAAVDTKWDELIRDDKRTLRKAFHLIQQHNTAEVH